ncbi:LysR family transcriptional regulator, partial [Pseudomonas aeruginosa]
LFSLLEGHQPPKTAVWALYPQQRHLTPKVRQLVDYLKEGLAQSHPGLAGEKNLS